MSNATFVRYEPEAEPENELIYEPVRIRDTVSRTSITDGEIDETSLTVGRADSNTNPYSGSIFATARQPNGMAATSLNDETLIEIDGLQASLGFWVGEGRIQKGPNGEGYREAREAPQETPEATPDQAQWSEESMARVTTALEPLDQSDLDGIAATAVAVALGTFSADTLVGKFSTATGKDPEESRARVETVLTEYTQQANGVLASSGIEASDLPAFYEWAKTARQGALRDTLNKHFHGADVSGYRKLASQWLAATPPSVDALKKAGIPTRSHGGSTELYLKGQWLSVGAAARSGLI